MPSAPGSRRVTASTTSAAASSPPESTKSPMETPRSPDARPRARPRLRSGRTAGPCDPARRIVPRIRLPEDLAGSGEQHHGGAVGRLGRIARFAVSWRSVAQHRLDGFEQRLGLEHHAFAAAERAIVHGAMAVVRELRADPARAHRSGRPRGPGGRCRSRAARRKIPGRW